MHRIDVGVHGALFFLLPARADHSTHLSLEGDPVFDPPGCGLGNGLLPCTSFSPLRHQCMREMRVTVESYITADVNVCEDAKSLIVIYCCIRLKQVLVHRHTKGNAPRCEYM